MTYLIAQLAPWLLLTAAFAALAGWAWAAWRAAPGQVALRRQREKLIHDLLASGANGAGDGPSAEFERERDTLRRRADLDAARVAEMERALTAARDRADAAAARIAELEREVERAGDEPRQAQAFAASVVGAEDGDAVLAAWRLRYFEQRVRYLESAERSVAPAAESPPPAPDPAWEWRARTAEARVAHLEAEHRALRATPATTTMQEEEAPFAANAQTDMLLRWRMLYLEKRSAYLEQERAAAAEKAARNMVDFDQAEAWKWRTRFLEARTRHLEGRLTVGPPAVSQAAPMAAEAAPAAAAISKVRPPALAAARGGAPDDFTLIDGVSALQQNTLYSLGVYHFDQVAAWTRANVAWVDDYLRLCGRVDEEEWVEQAEMLAREGVGAARRLEPEEA